MDAAVLDGLVVVMLTITATALEIRRHVEEEEAKLQAVVDIRAKQIGGWLKQQIQTARMADDGPIGEVYGHWRQAAQAPEPLARPAAVWSTYSGVRQRGERLQAGGVCVRLRDRARAEFAQSALRIAR